MALAALSGTKQCWWHSANTFTPTPEKNYSSLWERYNGKQFHVKPLGGFLRRKIQKSSNNWKTESILQSHTVEPFNWPAPKTEWKLHHESIKEKYKKLRRLQTTADLKKAPRVIHSLYVHYIRWSASHRANENSETVSPRCSGFVKGRSFQLAHTAALKAGVRNHIYSRELGRERRSGSRYRSLA